MKISKLVLLVVVSVLVSIVLGSALNAYTQVAAPAAAQSAPRAGNPSALSSNAPQSPVSPVFLPIVLLNAPTDVAWLLGGNAGTNPAAHFLGTTDNVALTLRVNNVTGWRLAPSGVSGGTPNIIGGYSGNTIPSTVSGATIGGGGQALSINTASGDSATIGGGTANTASGIGATIGGGLNNNASGDDATVGGGISNAASNTFSTVSGGFANVTSGSYATVGGGYNSTAGGNYATVGGGSNNVASGSTATISGGTYVTASGNYATVPGGTDNEAKGVGSFAAGIHAHALGDNTFLWADGTRSAVVGGANQFVVQATGGVYFYYSTDVTKFCKLTPGDSNWSCPSSRNLKDNFTVIDPQEVLRRVSQMPVMRWNMKDSDASILHLGPVAQDFYAAFGLGGKDDTHISSGDEAGVAFAAIQGLYQLVQEQDTQAAAQDKRITTLEQQVAAQQKDLAEIKAQIAALQQGQPAQPVVQASQWLPWGLGLAGLVWLRKRVWQ